MSHNEKLQAEIKSLRETTDGLNKKIARLATEKAEEEKRNSASLMHWVKEYEKAAARLENIEKFFRWNPEANKMHLNYVQEQHREAERKAAEQKRLAQEREQQQEKERVRQAQEQERQKALELERQREEQGRQRSCGMRMR